MRANLSRSIPDLNLFLCAAIVVQVLIILSTTAAASDLRPYKHPQLEMQFTAPSGWQQLLRPGDEGTHERVDPETGIHVIMWYTSTEQNAQRYLGKMSHMMDLDLDLEPSPRTIDGRDAWLLETSGTIDEKKVWTLLAVIPSGMSRLHPRENNLYLVQIWCPAPDHLRLAQPMQELLGSIRITDRLIHGGREYSLYPETVDSPHELPSPLVTSDGQEFITVRTRDNQYALVPVTVENGAPNDYAQGEWDKGRQLFVNADDFPTLAATGLHSEAELARTVTITGRPLADIDAAARPGATSIAGFVAESENILSVIRADNRLVTQLGLTHPQLAQPLFKVFNLILRDLELYRRSLKPVYNITSLFYGGHEIQIEASAAKGWQQSIFADEVRGYWQIKLWRAPTDGEKQFLQNRYGHLDEDQLAELSDRLFTLHTGEMVPFYIQRYGFYEGHTFYRADPVTIATLFGLMGLKNIDAAVEGDLTESLTKLYENDSK